MRRILLLIAMTMGLGACAADTGRQGLGYGDYSGYSCEQLGEEAVRLMRAMANRSEHILADDEALRNTASRQLNAVKRASGEKHC